MKKIGVIGGVSWLSTIDYYRGICELAHRQWRESPGEGPPSVPEMVIESLDINKSFGLRGTVGDEISWEGYDTYFREALQRLERAGAEVALIASNTPHNRFGSITRDTTLPVVNLFDAVARECSSRGTTDAVILGTLPTMMSTVLSETLELAGIRAIRPESDADRDRVVRAIAELQSGGGAGVADGLGKLASRMIPEPRRSSSIVCLSCTELPLAFPARPDDTVFTVGGVRYLDTTLVHVRAAYAAAIEG